MNMNWLKNSGKQILKGVAVAVAGTFILSGVALAANKQDKPWRGGYGGDERRPAYHQKNISPDKVAQMVAKAFGISQEKVAAYQAQGYDAKDLFQAGLLAKTAGKSYDEVISLKTKDNTWKELAEKLNITREQLAQTRQDMFAQHTAQILKTDKSIITDLQQQGYTPQDIVPAGVLANRAGKSIGDVILLKKINNTWREVAVSVGVSEKDFKNDMKEVFKKAGINAPFKKYSKKGH